MILARKSLNSHELDAKSHFQVPFEQNRSLISHIYAAIHECNIEQAERSPGP